MNGSKKRFSKGWFIGLILGIASSATLVYATVVTIPNTFNSGDTISASQMNANFSAIAGCPSGMVAVGPVCVDIYEASVWDAATGGSAVAPTICSVTGNDCKDAIFAQSRSGVAPAVNITWFQAQQACANVGKRLLTNAEWQMAAAGTVDTGCNIDSTGAVGNTGAGSCLSSWGVSDMIGNVWEWVADWAPGSGTLQGFATLSATYDGDGQVDVYPAANQGGAAPTSPSGKGFPAAVLRGGGIDDAVTGVFNYAASEAPSNSRNDFGFRCAR